MMFDVHHHNSSDVDDDVDDADDAGGDETDVENDVNVEYVIAVDKEMSIMTVMRIMAFR